MEKAHMRVLQQTNQCELAFHLRILNENSEVILEEDIHSVRSCTDVIGSLLAHTERKVTKILETKSALELKLNASLTVDNTNVNNDINCKEFIMEPKQNIVFSIVNQKFEVFLNAPLIQEIILPKVIHVDYVFQPTRFKSLYTNKDLCDYLWYSSIDKQSWIEVGNKFKYKPTLNDLDMYLKLKCIPKNEHSEGPPYEIISHAPVLQMSIIPICPFDTRHEYTKTYLTNNNQLRVVSYNILSNLYAENNSHHPYCPPQALSINYRKQLILKELLGYNADVICLQEVDLHVFSHYLKPKFFKMYKGLFHKKGYKISEGLACFFNFERFKLIESCQLVFCEELNVNPLFKNTWDLLSDCTDLRDMLMKQRTSLQVTTLKSKNANEILIVANTHLYYHSEASQVRLLQAYMALTYIHDTYQRYKYRLKGRISVVFCGDFNSVPESEVYEFMMKGSAETFLKNRSENNDVAPTRLSHPFKFTSAYGTPKYTNYTIDFKGCLDYIFFDKKMFKMTSCVPLPDESILAERTALPNEVFPSDHLALVCNLQWT